MIFFYTIKNKNEHSAFILLVLLLIMDLFFILLHIIARLYVPDTVNFYSLLSIETDRGYAEFYQYMKYIWIIILFGYIQISTKCTQYFSWIIVFTYFLLDDALQIHERIGELFTRKFDFNTFFNLRIQDYGELVASAFFGILLLTVLIWAYFQGSQTFRKISNDLGLFIAALVFFGVFFDMLAIAIKGIGLGIIEDGGEMIVISLTLWYVFLLSANKGNTSFFLVELLRKSLIKRKENNSVTVT